MFCSFHFHFLKSLASTLIIFSINCDTAFHVLSQVQLHPGFLFFAVPDSVVPSIEKVASMQNYSLKFETCYTYVLGNTKATGKGSGMSLCC